VNIVESFSWIFPITKKYLNLLNNLKKNNTVVMEYATKYVSFIQSGSLSKCDVWSIWYKCSTARSASRYGPLNMKREQDNRNFYSLSGKYPTMTGTTCESAYFTSIHKTHVRRRDAFRGWRRDPDAESIRRWEDSRLWYEDKVRMKEEWNTKSYLRHGIPRPQCARSFEIYFARLAWKIYLLEVTSALALRDSRVLWRDLIGEH